MPQKTIYVPADHIEIFERAQKELSESLSSIIVGCLKKRLNLAEETQSECYRIVIEQFSGPNDVPQRMAFKGRWLVGDHASGVEGKATVLVRGTVESYHKYQYSLARTARGRLGVYFISDVERGLEVYENFGELSAARIMGTDEQLIPNDVLAVFAHALGEDFIEERDI